LNKAEQFATRHLSQEILDIERSGRKTELPALSVFEKAIIYKYSEDGYEQVNELLRVSKGKSNSDFGSVLNHSLSKLPNFNGLVFRCVDLSNLELKRYKEALENNEPITEYSFVSTTKSELTAMAFGRNTRFVIYSRTGKEIEKIAKFGIYNPPNEKEVLFRSGRSFNILEVTKEQNHTLITMEEI